MSLLLKNSVPPSLFPMISPNLHPNPNPTFLSAYYCLHLTPPQRTLTFRSLEIQRYEGSSTLYGPYTLNAYQQEFAKLAKALVTGTPLPPTPMPYNWEKNMVQKL